MNAVIYTPFDTEYELFTRILREEAPDAQIVRDPDDGHFHCESEQDFVVVSVDGAKGMELAIKREINYKTMVVWITSDRYFAAMAIRYQVFEFLTRPFDEADFRAAVKRFLTGDIHPQYKLPVKPVGMVPAETL